LRHLTEDEVKARLAEHGVPVPEGAVATSPEEASSIARDLAGPVVVKALIPMGRRGKAGAIRFAETPEEAARHAAALLGGTVNGFVCRKIYVERKLAITRELYLSFLLDEYPATVLASVEGGVDIEEVNRSSPEKIVRANIDPLRGLPVWDGLAIWEKAGIEGPLLSKLGQLTATLYKCFRTSDATTLELNPIAVDESGNVVVPGAMMAIEDPMFEAAADEREGGALAKINERESRVLEANRRIPGGMMRYIELDGNIGMFVGGGGASLVQHDLMLAAGGRPADHMDASTTNPEKVRVLIDAILDNPRVRSLYVGWHYQQMARVDRRVIPIVQALKDRKVDTRSFPVVIRMFGPGEEAARRAAADLPGLHYMPHGSPMRDAVELITSLTNAVARQEDAA
jgi:succinyl-CoA synthetase beta subunit/citryl-CoA synthetase large subunit